MLLTSYGWMVMHTSKMTLAIFFGEPGNEVYMSGVSLWNVNSWSSHENLLPCIPISFYDIDNHRLRKQ